MRATTRIFFILRIRIFHSYQRYNLARPGFTHNAAEYLRKSDAGCAILAHKGRGSLSAFL